MYSYLLRDCSDLGQIWEKIQHVLSVLHIGEGWTQRWQNQDTALGSIGISNQHRNIKSQLNSFLGRNFGGQVAVSADFPTHQHSPPGTASSPATAGNLLISTAAASGMMFQCHTWPKENFKPDFSA